jgi:hypothetical protein
MTPAARLTEQERPTAAELLRELGPDPEPVALAQGPVRVSRPVGHPAAGPTRQPGLAKSDSDGESGGALGGCDAEADGRFCIRVTY